MEGRNGKWVNVDYTNRILEESTAFGHAGGGSGDGSGSSFRGELLGMSGSHDQDAGSPSASLIQVTVSEPVKQGEGMNAYISYKISTVTTRPQFSTGSFSVIRRYSDFVWLHGALYALYPGVVVPPLPEKLLVGRFSPEFIESRRRALQLFLQRCCMHPELQHSAHLTTFLEASEDALNSFKSDPRNAAHGKGAKGALFQWIDDTVSSISSTLVAAPVNLEKTPADVEVDDMMAYIDALEPIMAGLHKHAHGLTKRAREIADGLFEFGVSFTLLGKSEDNPSLQEGLSYIGHCSDQLAILAAEHAEREALNFEQPIYDYIRLVGAVKAALQKRNDVRYSYATAIADLDAKTVAMNKLFKSRGPSASTSMAAEERIQMAESDVMKAQQRVDDSKLEFDIVTERVMREVERFKREKLADFKQIILDYIQLQIEYSKKVEAEWNQVIPRLAQIHVEATGSASPSTLGAASHINGNDSNGLLSAPSGGVGVMIREDYIPSTGGDLSSDLASLSLGSRPPPAPQHAPQHPDVTI